MQTLSASLADDVQQNDFERVAAESINTSFQIKTRYTIHRTKQREGKTSEECIISLYEL